MAPSSDDVPSTGETADTGSPGERSNPSFAPGTQSTSQAPPGDSSTSPSQAEQAANSTSITSGPFGKAMQQLHGLINLLSIPSLAGFLHEGKRFEAQKENTRAIRAFESSGVDGAWNMGDVHGITPESSWPDRLLNVLSQGKKARIHRQEHKTMVGGLRGNDESTHRARVPLFKTTTTGIQYNTLDSLSVSVHPAPGVAVVAPRHNPVMSKIQDPLLHDSRIPVAYSPLAVKEQDDIEAHERLRAGYETKSDYTVPGSGVHIKWQPGASSDLGAIRPREDPAWNAFKFFYQAAKASSYAKMQSIELDFVDYQPLGGDGKLLWKDHPAEIFEFKQGLIREESMADGSRALLLRQPAETAEKRKVRSAFHPLRLHHFLCLFSEDYTFGYCIPASHLDTKYWTGDEYVQIQMSEVAAFRFTATENDWFEKLHTRIIRPHAHSERPKHNLPAADFASLYTAAAEAEIDEVEFVDAKGKGGAMQGYPWWKIERWNRDCAYSGFGLHLPLSRECRVANVAWYAYVWSVEEQRRYFETLELPKRLHQGDIDPSTPMLLIRAICVRTVGNASSTSFPSLVAGFRLDKAPFPCLYYVDCGTFATRGEEMSGLLFPSELVDHESLNKRYSDHLGQPVQSCREMMRKLISAGQDASLVFKTAARLTDLSKCLKLPFVGLQVREGREFSAAIAEFTAAQQRCEQALISWFKPAKAFAEEYYYVSFRDLLQALANEWVNEGILKNPYQGINALDEFDDAEIGDSDLEDGDEVEMEGDNESEEDGGEDEVFDDEGEEGGEGDAGDDMES